MCGLLRAQPFVTSATLESLLSRRRSRTPRLWRRRKLRQGAKFRITRFSNLYPRPILAGTIVWTSPTRAGLSHQPRRLRPVPTAAVRMSGAHTAQAQPLARQSQADCPRPQQASRSTPGQRRNPACQPRTQTRNRRPHMAQPHAQNAHPVQRRPTEHQPLVHLGQRPTRTRTTPTRLETTTPTTTPTRRRATLLRRTMKILVATALTQGTSPDDYHYGTEGRAGVAAGTV